MPSFKHTKTLVASRNTSVCSISKLTLNFQVFDVGSIYILLILNICHLAIIIKTYGLQNKNLMIQFSISDCHFSPVSYRILKKNADNCIKFSVIVSRLLNQCHYCKIFCFHYCKTNICTVILRSLIYMCVFLPFTYFL